MKPFSFQTRAEALSGLAETTFDLIIIGGGITGAGTARDAAQRKMRVLLLEKGDFGSGTSSKSSKLVHGGLRYLKEYDFGLTRESCVERNLLIRQNPHLVKPIPFLYPIYETDKEGIQMVRAGMWLYEMLGGFKSYRRHKMLNREETLEKVPGLYSEGLKGAAFYYDAAVDDTRLTLENIKSAVRHGAQALNYAAVIGFIYEEGRIVGVTLRDMLSWNTFEARGRSVINAAGVWVDNVRSLDSPQEHVLNPTKGVHLVVPSGRIDQHTTVAFNAPQDRRQMFAIPWGDVTLIGTTDTFFKGDPDDIVATREDVQYLLDATNHIFPGSKLGWEDVISVFSGIRPLVDSKEDTSAGAISREHQIFADESGLISMAGGKLTTYRLMAGELVDRALAGLPAKRQQAFGPCISAEPIVEGDIDVQGMVDQLVWKGVTEGVATHLVDTYGPGASDVLELCDELPNGRTCIPDRTPFLLGEAVHAVRHECAIHLNDILTRRIRMAIWTPGQGLAAADAVAQEMARELGWSEEEKQAEIQAYRQEVDKHYRAV